MPIKKCINLLSQQSISKNLPYKNSDKDMERQGRKLTATLFEIAKSENNLSTYPEVS